jgi:hypothetical protein
LDRRNLKTNIKKLRLLEIALTACAVSFYLICVASFTALADETREIAAIARLSSLRPEGTSSGILKEPVLPKEDPSLNSQIFDKTISDEMTQKFNSFNRAYEARTMWRLDGPEDYLRYQQANKDLVEWTIKKLLQYHFEHTLTNSVEQSVKRAAEQPSKPGDNNSGEKAAARAAIAVVNVQKAIRNSTFNLGEDTKTKFHYDFPSGSMKVGMTSPYVDLGVDYRIKPADPVVGSVMPPEKLGVGANKQIKLVNATPSVHYGLISSTLNYGVNKHLVGPLSAQVDQAHNVRDTSKDETLFRLNLGTSF